MSMWVNSNSKFQSSFDGTDITLRGPALQLKNACSTRFPAAQHIYTTMSLPHWLREPLETSCNQLFGLIWPGIGFLSERFLQWIDVLSRLSRSLVLQLAFAGFYQTTDWLILTNIECWYGSILWYVPWCSNPKDAA